MIDPEQELPRDQVEPYADHDPTIASMLRKGLPLTRNAYLAMNWGADLPDPADWNHGHEADVPECFRDPDAVRRDPARKVARDPG
jgi:hypothetical protein